VRFQVLTAASMMFRVVFWVILPCKMIFDRRFRWRQYAPLKRRSTIILYGSITQKTTLNIIRSYFPKYSKLHTRRRENLMPI